MEIVLNAAVAYAFNTAIQYLFPSNTSVEGQRLDDLGVVGSQYGAGIPTVYGRARVPGNVVWARPLREEVTRRKESAGKGSTVTITEYQYYATFAVLLCAGASNMRPLRIWADKKLLWQAPDSTLYLSGQFAGGGTWEFSPGGDTQTRSAVIESVEGTVNTPAYRGRSLLIVSELPVEQFGRRIPQLEVEVARGTASATAIIGDVLTDLCVAAGMPQANVQTAEVTVEAHGLRLAAPASVNNLIEPLTVAYALHPVNTGTGIAFRSLTQSLAATITQNDLVPGDDGLRRVPIKRLPEEALPNTVTVRYLDAQRDYQVNAQMAKRQTPRSRQAATVEAPIVLSAQQAASIADSVIYRAWVARVRFGPFTLPPKYLYLEPGDVVRLEVDGVQHTIRLTSVAIGANLAIECEGEAYEASVATGALSGSAGAFPDQSLPEYGNTTLKLLDVPALNDAEAQRIGYRVAATGSGAAWRSAVLEVSPDGGTTWAYAASLGTYTVMGFCNTTLPAPPANIGAGNIDTVSTVDVAIIKGTLAGVSDEVLIAGANYALVGSEIIQFGTVTVVSPGVYRLSRLLRGRRGTEQYMSTHASNETFVLLSTAPFIESNVATVGQSRQYRVTPLGGATSPPVAFTLTGTSVRPFSPIDVRGQRDGSGNLTITWIRRSRIGTELPDSGDIPLDEPTELYHVDVMNGSNVVRTIVASSQSCTYTAAQQTTDFGSPQSSITVRVYQVGQLLGRGAPEQAVV